MKLLLPFGAMSSSSFVRLEMVMRKVARHALYGIGLCLLLSGGTTPNASADDGGPSVTLMKHVTAGQEALKGGRWAEAREEFRKVVGLDPKTPEWYLGLYTACYQTKEWDQIAFALEKVFELAPAMKSQYSGEYGEALYYMGKYDQAVPALKAGLKYLDSPQAKESKPSSMLALVPPPAEAPPPTALPAPPPSATNTGLPPAPTATAPPATIEIIKPNDPQHPEGWDKIAAKPVDVDSNKLAMTLEGAGRCEGIEVAEYQGYEKSKDITFFHPPLAHFRIEKILKGPPLNKDMPVRYEFSDRTKNTSMPAGWKFGDDKMPKPGSKWIIFLEWCSPRDNMYDTYQGAFGRWEATDENLNKVYLELEKHSNR